MELGSTFPTFHCREMELGSTSHLSLYPHMQPRLGGDSRPVQRPPQVSETAAESSFDFLGKSSKGSAFDFVKAEIDSAKKK